MEKEKEKEKEKGHVRRQYGSYAPAMRPHQFRIAQVRLKKNRCYQKVVDVDGTCSIQQTKI